MSDTEKQQYTTGPGGPIVWGRCREAEASGHMGPHPQDKDCDGWEPERRLEAEGELARKRDEFQEASGSKSIHRWAFSLEDALRAIYRTWGERCENASELLQLVKRMKERETALEEANALLQTRCDTAYRRGVAEANRQHRKRVAEYLLVSERTDEPLNSRQGRGSR
jgi:hypothetical protein